MKKALFSVAAFLSAALVFAEINPPKRFLEIGLDGDIAFGENILSAGEIFQETLTIDFPAIAKNLGETGGVISIDGDADFWATFNVKGWGGGIAGGVDTTARLVIGKEIFDFLAYGNSEGTLLENARIGVNMSAFATAQAQVNFCLGNIKVRVKPGYYIPLVYIPNSGLSATVKNENGGIEINAGGPLDIYSVLNPGVEAGGDLGAIDFSSMASSDTVISDLFAAGGMNVGIEAEFPFVRSFDVGGYFSTPITPGHLKYKTGATVSYTAKAENVLGTFVDGGTPEFEQDTENIFVVDGTTASDYSVCTPLRFGAMASFHPFGKWFAIKPSIGFAARNPFGKDFVLKESMFPEYKLTVDATLFYVLGFSATTQYIDQLFAHGLGLRINLRALEIDAEVYSSGSNFAKSLSIGGAKAKVGIRIGI